jgi:hypothetical protein
MNNALRESNCVLVNQLISFLQKNAGELLRFPLLVSVALTSGPGMLFRRTAALAPTRVVIVVAPARLFPAAIRSAV